MRRTIEADLGVDPATVFAELEDLEGYGGWLDLVRRVEHAEPVPEDIGPAWWVTLRARIGPLARSKRLRMVRVRHDPPAALRFERCEIDGRDHSPWILDVAITDTGPAHTGRSDSDGAPEPSGTTRSVSVAVTLAYEGRLWSPMLDAVLGPQLEQAVPRLRRRLSPEP